MWRSGRRRSYRGGASPVPVDALAVEFQLDSFTGPRLAGVIAEHGGDLLFGATLSVGWRTGVVMMLLSKRRVPDDRQRLTGAVDALVGGSIDGFWDQALGEDLVDLRRAGDAPRSRVPPSPRPLDPPTERWRRGGQPRVLGTRSLRHDLEGESVPCPAGPHAGRAAVQARQRPYQSPFPRQHDHGRQARR